MQLYSLSCLLFPILMCCPGHFVDERCLFSSHSGIEEPPKLSLHKYLLPSFDHNPAGYNRSVRSTEFGISLGFGNYAGDVAEKVWVWPETRPAFGAFFRHHFSPRWALKTQVYAGNVGGTDARADNIELRARGLKFNSHLLELSVAGEWYFLKGSPQQRRPRRQAFVTPYLYAGVGGVLMHPQVEPVGLSAGTGLAYPLQESGLAETALVLPFGGGFRMKIAEKIALRLEGGWRPVLSDYLDGVSQNGNPGKNDWYYAALVSLSFGF